ncbi:tripartite motif-containing protein 16-like [Notolabrus celidotus]|uniref:tripartite motif-containing protein 16-like n=1 Tax=Notolabrus celidotus TaxID=1203425 RepID=UPI00149067DD|nr:tripartite motif-containing protein 16-like [Notolabrus celidotus]
MELDPNHFCCSVCLDLLKDPVTIPCGHSYCKSCIEGFWDQNEEKGDYSCPQCRESFSPRPVVRRNNILAKVVETLKSKDTLQASSNSAGACASPADISCDFCCGTDPNKATMSCLTCVASYCPAHLEPHYSVPVLKKHQLVSATVPLQKKTCAKHNKLMEVYCRTDKMCICCLCMIEKHHFHHTVSAAAERIEQQKQLTESQKKVQERGKDREKELKELLEALKDFKKSSQTAVETSDKIFGELIWYIQKNCSLAKLLITTQEKTAVAQAEGLQLQLEEEIAKLKKRDAELEQISHVEDNIHFIQTFQSLSASCESPDLPSGLVVRPKHTFKVVTDCMSKLKETIASLLKETKPSITTKVSAVNVLLQPEPKTREEFLRYQLPLRLHPGFFSQNMTLSNGNLRATYCAAQTNASHSCIIKRNTEQVWGREALTERCYWEVRLHGSTWCVAVSYEDAIGAFSYHSEFGRDKRSWSLECSSKGCSFKHNDQSKNVSGSVCYSQIGVFLDYLEGTVSFYGICSTLRILLHRVHTTFTEPLYPCIGFKVDGSQEGEAYHAELVKM